MGLHRITSFLYFYLLWDYTWYLFLQYKSNNSSSVIFFLYSIEQFQHMYCCSFNCRTIGGDMDHLAKTMDKFHIVCLQSTHMVAANMRFQNMTLSCNKYVGFLYRNDTNPQLSLMERCASIITNKYTIISAYCPLGKWRKILEWSSTSCTSWLKQRHYRWRL